MQQRVESASITRPLGHDPEKHVFDRMGTGFGQDYAPLKRQAIPTIRSFTM
jgi:hypothetical protein